MECSVDGCSKEAEVSCNCNRSYSLLCPDHCTNHLRLSFDHKLKPVYEKGSEFLINKLKSKFNDELIFYLGLKKALTKNSLDLINTVKKESNIILNEIRRNENNTLKMLKILESGNFVPEYLNKNYKPTKFLNINIDLNFNIIKQLEELKEYYAIYKIAHLNALTVVPDDIESNFKLKSKEGQGLHYAPRSEHTSVQVNDKYVIIGNKEGDIFLYNRIDLTQDKVLLGHKNHIHCLYLNGAKLISGGLDNSIITWNLETFTQISILENVKIWRAGFAIGKQILLCMISSNLCVIRLENLNIESVFEGENYTASVEGIAINDGDSIGVTGDNTQIIIWDIYRKSVQRRIDMSSFCIQFINLDTIISGGDKNLTVVKIFNEKYREVINTGQENQWEIVISRDRKYFATRSLVQSQHVQDKSLKIWSIEDFSYLNMHSGYSLPPTSSSFTDISNEIAILLHDEIKFLKFDEMCDTGANLRYFSCIAASGNYVVIGNTCGDCLIVSLETEKLEFYFNLNCQKVNKIIFKGDLIICSTAYDIILVHIKDPKANYQIKSKLLIHDLAICEENIALIILCDSGNFFTWDITSCSTTNFIQLPSNAFHVEYISNISLILTISSDLMQLWNFPGLNECFSDVIEEASTCISRYSGFSTFATGRNDGTISLWEINNEGIHLNFRIKTDLHSINSIIFVNELSFIASSNDSAILIFTVGASDSGLINFDHHYQISSSCVVGDKIVSCLIDGSLILWDIKTQKEIKKIDYNIQCREKSEMLEIFGYTDGNVYLCNINTNTTRSLGSEYKPYHRGAVRKVKLYKNLAITASWSEVKIWNVEAMTLIIKITEREHLERYRFLYPEINEFHHIFEEKKSIFHKEVELVPENSSCIIF